MAEVSLPRRRVESAEMARRGRLGAAAQHAKHDPRETTRAARAAALLAFERAADPTNELSPDARRRRAAELRREHMRELARQGATKRRQNAEQAAAYRRLTLAGGDGAR